MIRSAVEELLRFESPVQFTARVLKEDIELCGQHIPQKWTILCMLGAANRDPKRFKDPNQLDLKRLNNQHLAFSAGPHACIGGQLARLEGQIAILNLVQRFPEMKLTGPRPEWASTFGLRGLNDLRVAASRPVTTVVAPSAPAIIGKRCRKETPGSARSRRIQFRRTCSSCQPRRRDSQTTRSPREGWRGM